MFALFADVRVFFFLTGAIGMSRCRAGGDGVPWFCDAWFVDGLRGGVVGVWGHCHCLGTIKLMHMSSSLI